MNIVKDINILLEEFSFEPRRVEERNKIEYESNKKKLDSILKIYNKELDSSKYKAKQFSFSQLLNISSNEVVCILELESNKNIIAVTRNFSGESTFEMRVFKK